MDFCLPQREGFVLEFCKASPLKSYVMLCKILRSPLKNNSLGCFFAAFESRFISYEKKKHPQMGCFYFCRRGRDSNPRELSPKLISSQPRYDHFDTSAY